MGSEKNGVRVKCQSKPTPIGGFGHVRGKAVGQCAFSQAPAAADVPSCAQAGVLGVLPGITGTLQANEALKLALGIGQPLTGRLLMFDALNLDLRQATLKSRPDCPACGTGLGCFKFNQNDRTQWLPAAADLRCSRKRGCVRSRAGSPDRPVPR